MDLRRIDAFACMTAAKGSGKLEELSEEIRIILP